MTWRPLAKQLVQAIADEADELRARGEPVPLSLRALALSAVAAIHDQKGTDEDTDWQDDRSDTYGRSNGRAFYSRKEVAAMRGCSTKTIARRIAAGQLRETPLGIPASEIDALTEPTKETTR